MIDDLHIRWAIKRDLRVLLNIEQMTSPDDYWTHDDFVHAFQDRQTIPLVVEDTRTEELVGFVFYKLDIKTLRILNIAVSPDYARKGIGRYMMNYVLEKKLNEKYRPQADVSVCELNLAAQQFFKATGMKCIGTRKKANGDTMYDFRYRKEAPVPEINNRIKQYL